MEFYSSFSSFGISWHLLHWINNIYMNSLKHFWRYWLFVSSNSMTNECIFLSKDKTRTADYLDIKRLLKLNKNIWLQHGSRFLLFTYTFELVIFKHVFFKKDNRKLDKVCFSKVFHNSFNISMLHPVRVGHTLIKL